MFSLVKIKIRNMKKYLLSITVTCMLVLSAEAQTVLIDQTNVPNNNGLPAQIVTDMSNGKLEAADNFSVPTGELWTIDSLEFEGLFGFSGGSFSSFEVNFYHKDQTTGAPGNLLATDSVVIPAVSSASNTIFMIQAKLNNPVTCVPGDYFVSIMPVMAFSGGDQTTIFQIDEGTADYVYYKDDQNLFGAGLTTWTELGPNQSTFNHTTKLDFKLVGDNGACTVNIPDANFKSYLLGSSAINTNGDTEIQCSEATAFSGIINCTNMGISDLTGVEAFINAVNIKCPNNSLTTLDVSSNTGLMFLDCKFNNLTSITFGNNTLLESVDFGYNDISSINLSTLPALESLTSQQNDLTILDVSSNPLLSTLSAQSNNIDSLNLSNHSNIISISVDDNPIHYLNLANGNNTNISFYSSSNTPNLLCVEVDDPTYSTTNWTIVDAANNFSTDCSSFVGMNEREFSFQIYPNPVSDILRIETRNPDMINALRVVGMDGKVVWISYKVSQLDISILPSGMYVLELLLEDGQTSRQQLIKQ